MNFDDENLDISLCYIGKNSYIGYNNYIGTQRLHWRYDVISSSAASIPHLRRAQVAPARFREN